MVDAAPNAACPAGRIAATTVLLVTEFHPATKVPAGVATTLGPTAASDELEIVTLGKTVVDSTG
jgi:hypothetical protein